MATHGDPLPSTPDQYPSSDKFDTIIEVKVGPALDRTFYVHKGIVTFYSGYFRAALNGRFAEAGTGVLELPTEDVDTFERFVDWIYHRRHDFVALKTSPAYDAVCKLWVFADKRQVPMLANAMIDILHKRIVNDWTMPLGQLEYIYDNTTASSTLRRFVIWYIANAGSSSRLQTPGVRECWPADAVWDALSKVWELKERGSVTRLSKDDVAKVNLCESGYHDHSIGVQCAKTAP